MAQRENNRNRNQPRRGKGKAGGQFLPQQVAKPASPLRKSTDPEPTTKLSRALGELGDVGGELSGALAKGGAKGKAKLIESGAKFGRTLREKAAARAEKAAQEAAGLSAGADAAAAVPAPESGVPAGPPAFITPAADLLPLGTVVSCDDVVDRVRDLHYNEEDFGYGEHEDEGDLLERLERYDSYRLMRVPLADVPNPLEPDEYEPADDLLLDYVQRDTEPPPVVLSHDLDLYDGYHRVAALNLQANDPDQARRREWTHMLAWVGVEDAARPAADEDERDGDDERDSGSGNGGSADGERVDAAATAEPGIGERVGEVPVGDRLTEAERRARLAKLAEMTANAERNHDESTAMMDEQMRILEDLTRRLESPQLTTEEWERLDAERKVTQTRAQGLGEHLAHLDTALARMDALYAKYSDGGLLG